MKKLILAALMAALIMTAAVAPAFAEDITETSPEAEITEAVTEAVTEPVTEAITEAETEPVTDAETEPMTEPETETEAVDGALVAKDYVARMFKGARDWAEENPETIGRTVVALVFAGLALVATHVFKKERKAWGKQKEEFEKGLEISNNNTIEMAKTIKSAATEVKNETMQFAKETRDEIKGFDKKLSANCMETRAISVVLAELIKDARLPDQRKEAILELYNKVLAGEVSEDEKHDEA